MFHNSYSSPNIIRAIKSKSMAGMGHVDYMGERWKNEEHLLLQGTEFCENEVLTAALMKIQAFWAFASYRLANNDWISEKSDVSIFMAKQ